MSTTTVNPLDMREQVAGIERAQEETRKFVAEQHGLIAAAADARASPGCPPAARLERPRLCNGPGMRRTDWQDGHITVYDRLANGDVAAKRTVTDPATQFISTQEIGFSPPQ